MTGGFTIMLRAAQHQEDDGSHTVTITISGLPTIGQANRIAEWVRTSLRANVAQVGGKFEKPEHMQ